MFETGSLSKIAEIISGYAFKSTWFGSGSDKIIRISDIKNNQINSDKAVTFDSKANPVPEQFRIREGDILMALSGATTGKIGIANKKDEGAYLNQRVAIIRGESLINSKYIKHVLSGENLNKLLLSAGGAAQPNLSPKDLSAMQIPLPPLEEQKRIAAILDKADALRRKRQQAIDLTDQLLRSVFLDMFGDPVTNPKGWKTSQLNDISVKITDGTHQSPVWSESGIPFLFIKHIVNNEIIFNVDKYIDEEQWLKLTKRSPIEAGDVLYTTVGSYGNAALVKASRYD